MSRSVSPPSSVTKTSPCWNGLIVPGSTLRYGSNFCSCTRRPRAFRRRPSEAATIPFPSAETTPPVTKTYFGARALTGFQGSSAGGRRSAIVARLDEVVQPLERLHRVAAAKAYEKRALDDERCHGAALVDRSQRELDVDSVTGQLECEPLHRDDVENQEHPRGLRAAKKTRLVGTEAAPPRTGGEAAAVGLDAGDAGPPVGQVVGLGEERPDVVDRREERPVSCVPRQGTPARRACARARPCARSRRAARCACGSDRPAPSRPGSGGRRRARSAGGA